ncbi:MAG: hypothetical protein COV43_04365 [Deltaproteobacteria bacterium CG11_big_fil_rev_8_21_14_0_20_42_23]|nr:MAG: hypothetical protein COV43_04365 [Deltaproteobacteria bacterium CG11_big_fil_rev_8_21_14_0_20_42_23]PJC65008.1 MAG: hypothetical protein CO021_00755 [Deltaproteobacteria bacterium CG_4_9_14_0_2_um_filter_42_21]
MASLTKRYGHTWYLVDRIDGKQKWIKLGRISKAEAKAVKARYESDQTYLKLDIQSNSRITFAECSEEYLQWAKNYKGADTMHNEKDLLNFMIKTLGERKLESIVVEDLEALWNNKGYKANTILKRIAVIRAIYKYALQRKYLKRNISLELKRPSLPVLPPKHVNPKIIEKIFSVMTPENGFRFESIAKFKILYYTGLRPIEVLRLQARDIDFTHKQILVRKSKTKRYRSVPVHQNLMEIVTQLTLGRTDKDYLFPSRHDKSKHQVNLRGALIRAVELAGVKGAKITPYTFRHQFATTVLNNTRDLRTVQQLLGHTTIQMTTRYATALDDKLKEAVDSL